MTPVEKIWELEQYLRTRGKPIVFPYIEDEGSEDTEDRTVSLEMAELTADDLRALAEMEYESRKRRRVIEELFAFLERNGLMEKWKTSKEEYEARMGIPKHGRCRSGPVVPEGQS